MSKKKLLVTVLVAVLMATVVACGNTETRKKSEDENVQDIVKNETEKEVEAEDEEKVEEELKTDVAIPEETTEPESNDMQTVKPPVKKDTTSAPHNTTANNNGAGNNNSTNSNVNSENTPPSAPTHEHAWVTEHNKYEHIKTYVNGCNGCGYPLFTVIGNGTQPIENLYSHPACYSEKLGMDCTGGGFHNESYTRGYCYSCGGKVEYRQCMWTEMGKRCSKNVALGNYEKIEFDQNHFMYLDSCDCGYNRIVIDGEDGKGLIAVGEYCSICGEKKAN